MILQVAGVPADGRPTRSRDRASGSSFQLPGPRLRAGAL